LKYLYLVDKDEISGIDFVLSGSSVTDIKRGAERLPGRRGPEVKGGWDRLLLPLSFYQFVEHSACNFGLAVWGSDATPHDDGHHPL
jgi:predicted AAA+ superfamily ATPase